MGIKMALGAEQGTIVRVVLVKGGTHLGLGIALGLALGAVMGQPMKFVLYGVETGDPTV